MSYCRFSSDNFKCDIYAYESVYNYYTIHVASNRIIGKIPEVDIQLLIGEKPNHELYVQQSQKRSKFFETCKRKPIGLKHDGQTFDCRTLKHFKETLLMLQQEGYNVPSYVIEAIDQEINELQN